MRFPPPWRRCKNEAGIGAPDPITHLLHVLRYPKMKWARPPLSFPMKTQRVEKVTVTVALVEASLWKERRVMVTATDQ